VSQFDSSMWVFFWDKRI